MEQEFQVKDIIEIFGEMIENNNELLDKIQAVKAERDAHGKTQ
jgi:uncharacterized coiled-coil DUF342 family protein